MDWLTLTKEVLAKRNQDLVENVETPVGGSTNGFFKLLHFEREKEKLSPLEAAALSCILEMASFQLFIIDAGISESSPNSSDIVPRKKVMEVIHRTENEIRSNGTFEVLCKKAKEQAETNTAYNLLTKSTQCNKIRIRDLRKKLKDIEYNKLRDLNVKQEIIASLKDKIHEEVTKNDIKLGYVDRLEAARQEQNKIRCQNAESLLETKLQLITDKYYKEIRVHDEMRTFLVLEEQALLKAIEKWKEFYESEMKRRKEKIKLLKARKKEQKILFHDLSQLYEERQREINEFLDFKEKLRKQQEHDRFVNKMATKIQAWWRGTMVRKGLGPFKKKKKPGKEKKKK